MTYGRDDQSVTASEEQALPVLPACKTFYENAYDTIAAMSKWKKTAVGVGIALLFSGAMNIYTYRKAQEGKKQYERLQYAVQQENIRMI